MKNIFFKMLILGAFIALNACQKVPIPDLNDFSVSVQNQSVKAGDTVIFNVNGNPDVILFYSGEAGRNYDSSINLNMNGSPKIVFQTAMSQGVLQNQDSLRLLVVKNLNGYDSASIVNANWIDITDRNTKWPSVLNIGVFTTSDSIDISDFLDADSINIAFKYIGKNYPSAQQRRWLIQNFTLSNCFSSGINAPIFSTFANTGWFQLDVKNTRYDRTIDSLDATKNFSTWNVGELGFNRANAPLVVGTATRCNRSGVAITNDYPLSFNPGTITKVADNEDWIITSSANIKSARQLSIPIKRLVDRPLRSYSYVFTRPGTYQAAFVAQNQRLDKTKRVIQRVTVNVN